MPNDFAPDSRSRRKFLATSSGLLAAAAALPKAASALMAPAASDTGLPLPAGVGRKIPIGVFRSCLRRAFSR